MISGLFYSLIDKSIGRLVPTTIIFFDLISIVAKLIAGKIFLAVGVWFESMKIEAHHWYTKILTALPNGGLTILAAPFKAIGNAINFIANPLCIIAAILTIIFLIIKLVKSMKRVGRKSGLKSGISARAGNYEQNTSLDNSLHEIDSFD